MWARPARRYRRVVPADELPADDLPLDDLSTDGMPLDPDEWTDEQWQAHLRATADGEGDDEGSALHRKLRTSAGGSVLGAAMLGLEQALYGEKPKEEVVAEAESDDPDGDLSVFDPDDPASATLHLRPGSSGDAPV